MEQKIKKIIGQMTLEEKALLCSGSDFWRTKEFAHLHIPSIMMSDGPHGLRKQDGDSDHLGLNKSVPATCFPTAVGLASSWNRDIIKEVGSYIGVESQAEGVSILLGPGANIKRSPLCGRNFEYYSEDPYLTGELAAAHIEGVQSEGVGTSLKHFAVNNQEYQRMTTDVSVDERTMREIYLTGFETAIKKSRPWTLMSAYNKVNGTYCSENEYLLTDILRKEWGHDGIVLSDWGAVNELEMSIKSGMELEMPSSNGEGPKRIIKAVQSGVLDEDTLDSSVERLLGVIFKAYNSKKSHVTYDADKHHQFAKTVASESMVLLKNEDDILPLSKKDNIAIIGDMAEKVRYQGGGSSHINPSRLDSIYEEIKNKGTRVTFSRGYDVSQDHNDESYLIEEAIKHAVESDKVVIFVGLPDRYESEGYDRNHLSIPLNQQELIQAIAKVQKNIVVVLSNGSPIEMPWINKVKAVLEAYLGGQATGGAIADLLFGDENPSGKLAETFPARLKDTPAYLDFPGDGKKVSYRESVYVGYRFYDSRDIKPLFPFGHGLSYTEFQYSDLTCSQSSIKEDDEVEVSLNVTNVGAVVGKEVIQLYVQDIESTVSRPEKELKGFYKINLQPGETKRISFTLGKRSFAYYDVNQQDWCVETGEFKILIGKSSKEIVLEEKIIVQSTKEKKWSVHRNTTIGELLKNEHTSQILQHLQSSMGGSNDNAPSDAVSSEMLEASMNALPLRALIPFSQGQLTEESLTILLKQFNQALKNNQKVSGG